MQRCRLETSSTDFVDWLTYLEMEPSMFHREDHYFAQIAAWVCRSINPKKKVNVKDFLIKFVSSNENEKRTNIEKGKAATSFFGRLIKSAAGATRR